MLMIWCLLLLHGVHYNFLINSLYDAAVDIDMFFNINKTVCMIFKPVGSHSNISCKFPAFTAAGTELCFVSQFKYLGHIISYDGRDDLDIKREIRSFFTRCNILKSRFMRCSIHVKLVLFRVYCVCLYGTALWSNHS